MGEIKAAELQETQNKHIENFQNIKPEGKLTQNEANAYWDKVRDSGSDNNEVRDTGIPDKFYSTKEQREKYLPKNGEWLGEPGESKFISNDPEVNKELAKFGLDGIEYKNCVPDFSKCSVISEKIENMTDDRITNGKAFYGKLRDEDYFGTEREAKEFKRDNNLNFHECADMHTCQLVPEKIHQAFTHAGGRFECYLRDASEGIGGFKFDE